MWKTIALLGLIGCAPDPFELDFDLDFRSGTHGERGIVEAGYAEGCGVELLGGAICPLSGPIVAGATARISVWTDEDGFPEGVEATIGDPAIATLARIEDGAEEPSFAVHGLTAGNTMVELRQGGELLDRFPIRVAEAVSIELVDQGPIFTGATVSVPVIARDANGHAMFGRGAIAFEGDPQLVPTTSYDPAADRRFAGTDHVVVVAAATPAAATVTATLGGEVATLVQQVVGVEAVARVEKINQESANDQGEALAMFWAEDAGGNVIRGAHCGIAIQAAFPVDLDANLSDVAPGAFAVDMFVLRSEQHGVAKVSCTLGAHAAVGTVQF